MKVARQKGLKIPEDLQIIGFTDGVLSKHAFSSTHYHKSTWL